MSCQGCKKRKHGFTTEFKKALEAEPGRRRFIRATVAGMAGLLAVTKVQAKSLLAGFVTPEEADVNAAIQLMRILTVRSVVCKTTELKPDGTHVHVYGSKEAIMASLVELIQSPETAAEIANYPETRAFWESLNPSSPTSEVYPGWIVDIDVRPASGYVIVISQRVPNADGSRVVLVSDHSPSIIYRTKFYGWPVPLAENFEAAPDFPNVVPINRYSEYSKRDLTGKASYILAAFSNRLRQGLKPVELSTCFITCTGPSPYGCSFKCFFGCMTCPTAAHPCCQENPGTRFYAAKHCGYDDCPWCYTDCSNGGTNCANCQSTNDCSKMGACKTVGSLLCCKCPCGVNCY